MPFKDHFQTLRVSHKATLQQVQKAYYDRLKFFHPDYFQDDLPRRAIAETETKCLNEAFEVVGRPGERERYITEWERHQTLQRPPDRSLAVEQSLADARSDLKLVRLQLSELRATLEQRERDLEAANLGMRQGYQRVTSLQEAAQSFQESARQLQARLLDRDLEVRQVQGRADGLERQVSRLQTEVEQAREEGLQVRQALVEQKQRLADAERQAGETKRELDVLRRRREPTSERPVRQEIAGLTPDEVPARQSLLEELQRAATASEQALGLRQAELDERSLEVLKLRQSTALAQQQVREQGALLDETARQMRGLIERLQVAEGELGRLRQSAQAGAETASTEVDSRSEKAQLQELAAALAQRTEEARQAQAVLESHKERIRILESVQRAQTRSESRRGVRERLDVAVESAAGWLSPRRATTILTGLMLALCALAVALVLLTVSFDLPALASGLGRLGTALGALTAR
jgi:curved DNA-binding protein CbpA